MNLRLAACVAVALALVWCATVLAPSLAFAGVSVSRSPDVRFPDRSFVLTLPEHIRLGRSQVSVTENGGPVRNLRVAPVGAERRAKLGVVLAIDASRSMAGEPFSGAIEAAQVFADERSSRQPFAAVTFGTGSRLLLPFTDDEGRIAAALAEPGTPAGGTDMYDAALRSIELVNDSGLRGGFVVVLSDGTDHGSSATAEEVIRAANDANVKIYTVGLQSERFDPDSLSKLAEETGGEYSQATSSDQLSEIYGALGAQFSNAHVVSYRSTVGPGEDVAVKIAVQNLGVATTSYTSPLLKLRPPPLATNEEDAPGIPVLAIIVVVGLLLAAFLILVRGPRQTARTRIARYIGMDDGGGNDGNSLTGRLARGAERSLHEASWWEGFEIDVEVAGIKRAPGQIVISAVAGAIVVAFIGTSIAGTALVGFGVLLIAPLAVRFGIRMLANRQRRVFGDQLADHLSVVGGSLRVGHSLPAALSAALDEAPDPARREFERAVADERLGMPLEDALGSVSHRMKNGEVQHVALLAKLQREVGSDAAEMVDQVVTTVRERQELRRTVQTLTAQGRFAQMVLSVLPLGALLLLTLTNRAYVEPLWTTKGGHIVLGIAAALVIAGSLVIHKIVKIKI
jgi:tight adherence protein B